MAIEVEVYRILQSCYERKILEMILADRSYSLTFVGLKSFSSIFRLLNFSDLRCRQISYELLEYPSFLFSDYFISISVQTFL